MKRRPRLPQLPYLLREVDKRACLYEIVQRRAGWACVFYEPPPGYELPSFRSPDRDGWKRHLVVRRYFPTLRQALAWELKRLRTEAKEKPPMPVDKIGVVADPNVPAGSVFVIARPADTEAARGFL